MARTSGTYAAPSSSWNPAVEGTVVDEADFNTLLDDIESALTESVYTGGLGSTDNVLLRTDGTDTKKAQGSSVVLSDGGSLSSILNLAMTGGLLLTEGSLTLANGANTDVAVPTGTIVAVTGPTGAFSINGFVAPSSGRVLIIYNPTAQNMTITNDATSTAANRIYTLTGADVALTGTSLAGFYYSATSSRWILMFTQG